MKLVTCISLASFAALAACTAAPSSDATQASNAADTAACTDTTQAAALAQALAAPIKPPQFAAGLDLKGDDQWSGIKQAAVEAQLCAGTSQGADDATVTDPENYFSWGGNAQPIAVGFSQATGQLKMIQMNPGYTGTVDFKSRQGSAYGDHTYSAKIGEPVMRDGQPFLVDFAGDPGAAGSEIVDALVATFAPELTAIEGDCRPTQRCLLRVIPADGNTPAMAIIGSRDVHFYMVFPGTGDQPAMSTSQYFYMFPSAPGYTPPPPVPPTP
jgi:hypothetical protein